MIHITTPKGTIIEQIYNLVYSLIFGILNTIHGMGKSLQNTIVQKDGKD